MCFHEATRRNGYLTYVKICRETGNTVLSMLGTVIFLSSDAFRVATTPSARRVRPAPPDMSEIRPRANLVSSARFVRRIYLVGSCRIAVLGVFQTHCNGRSENCEMLGRYGVLDSARCVNCTGNSRGDRCDNCRKGYFNVSIARVDVKS